MSPSKNLTESHFWKKTPFKGFLLAALAMDLAAILIFVFIRGNLPPVVPFLYGRPMGEAQLVPAAGLLAGPAISVLFIAINIFIEGLSADIFAKKLLVVTAFVLSLLTTVTFIKIILLIGFF